MPMQSPSLILPRPAPMMGFGTWRAGVLELRLAATPSEIAAAQALRHEVFLLDAMGAGEVARPGLLDADRFDEHCQHLIVVDTSVCPERVVGTYRLIDGAAASACGGFYSESEYDLSELFRATGGARHGLLELGRSCVAPAYRSSAAISLLWRGIAAHCDAADIDYLFGCASFPGTDPRFFAGELALLHRDHLSPLGVRALPDRYVPMADQKAECLDRQRLWRALPPLIRGYLQVGAQVADGAVIDHEFGTVDVFVILDTATIRDRYRRHFMRAI